MGKVNTPDLSDHTAKVNLRLEYLSLV